MNTDTISTGIIAVDYSKSLQNMMADGSYDWVNPSVDGLWSAIGRIIDCFTQTECKNFFTAAGYAAT